MKKILYLFSLVFVLGCSSDDEAPLILLPPAEVLPVIATQNPTFTTGGYIKFNGNLQSEGSTGYFERGFCWGLNTNPVYSFENSFTADGSGTGPYFREIAYYTYFTAGQTYNVRAYVKTSSSSTPIVYGNNITFTIPQTYTTSMSSASEILSHKCKLTGTIGANDGVQISINNKGFCISTSPNPNITNSTLYPVSGTALGTFTTDTSNLIKNTTYYVRAYGYNNTSNVYYSPEITFKTTGFLGASGGYVFYDKGEVSNGWRYLEASPSDLTYNSSTLIKWGCTGTSIFQTSTLVGTGLENTNRILQFCNDANCAARICDNYTVNGISDWFLPSRDEIYLMDSSLDTFVQLGNATNQVHWSSSEYDSGTALLVNTYYSFGPGFGISKSNNNLVRAVRRF